MLCACVYQYSAVHVHVETQERASIYMEGGGMLNYVSLVGNSIYEREKINNGNSVYCSYYRRMFAGVFPKFV
jgi:hypothetical protein